MALTDSFQNEPASTPLVSGLRGSRTWTELQVEQSPKSPNPLPSAILKMFMLFMICNVWLMFVMLDNSHGISQRASSSSLSSALLCFHLRLFHMSLMPTAAGICLTHAASWMVCRTPTDGSFAGPGEHGCSSPKPVFPWSPGNVLPGPS